MSTISSSTTNTQTMSSEEAFSERVKKTFGNLFSPTLTPKSKPPELSKQYHPLPNPVWSLTGAAVEKKEWRRDTVDRDSNPCGVSFDDLVSCARRNKRVVKKGRKKVLLEDEDLLVEDEEEEEVDDDEDEISGLEDWEVRRSIGLDSTLDHEDEEDTFDKVAMGRENAGERLYMGDILDKNQLNAISQDDLTCDRGRRQRDNRANRLAARMRLQEDDAEATTGAEQSEPVQVPPSAAVNTSENSADSVKVKPILKRKERGSTAKSSKRVRFDPGFVNDGGPDASVKEDRNPSEITDQATESLSIEERRRVPDYVQNPHNLDSADELNDKLNSGAYTDFVDTVKNSENAESGLEQEDANGDLTNSVTYVPKEMFSSTEADGVQSELTQDRDSNMKHFSTESCSVADIAAEKEQATKVDNMDVDECETTAGDDRGTTVSNQGCQNRTKSQADEAA